MTVLSSHLPLATTGTIHLTQPAGTSAIAADLRRIADEVEAGRYTSGEITTAVFLAGGTTLFRRTDMGEHHDWLSVHGLLALAQR